MINHLEDNIILVKSFLNEKKIKLSDSRNFVSTQNSHVKILRILL